MVRRAGRVAEGARLLIEYRPLKGLSRVRIPRSPPEKPTCDLVRIDATDKDAEHKNVIRDARVRMTSARNCDTQSELARGVPIQYALIAQLDRAKVYETLGQRFESS